jgi:hypothetical protein
MHLFSTQQPTTAGRYSQYSIHPTQTAAELHAQHDQLTKQLENIEAHFFGKCKSVLRLVEELSQICMIDTRSSCALDEHQLSQITHADHAQRWTQLDKDELIALAKVR